MRIIEWEKIEKKMRKRRKRKKRGNGKRKGGKGMGKGEKGKGNGGKRTGKSIKITVLVTYLFLDRIPIPVYGTFFLFLVLQHVCCLLGMGWGEFR